MQIVAFYRNMWHMRVAKDYGMEANRSSDLPAGWRSPGRWESSRWSLPCAGAARRPPRGGSAPLARDTPWPGCTWAPAGTPAKGGRGSRERGSGGPATRWRDLPEFVQCLWSFNWVRAAKIHFYSRGNLLFLWPWHFFRNDIKSVMGR